MVQQSIENALPEAVESPSGETVEALNRALDIVLRRLQSPSQDNRSVRRLETAGPEPSSIDDPVEFLPREPSSLRDVGASEQEVTALAMKYLLKTTAATGRQIAAQLKLAYSVVQPLIAQMKSDHRIIYKNSAEAGDFLCELTAAGVEHARRAYEHCSY
ncbi:MAG TPA: hypothetical protein VKB78_11985, partial [Pirellulales bacterium]|nr:hypothetical protein [Pirellulales bacterium]